MPLCGHGEAKYPHSTRLDSSAGRGWTGLFAETWRHRAGDLPDIEPRETEIIVLTRGRLQVRRRGDGRLQRTAAVPGTVWLCPAGIREDMIRLYNDLEESIHIYLPAAPLSLSAAWQRHSSLLLRLCAVPLLISCKPSEAFLSVYLTQPVAEGGKGLSSAQLNEQVWPYDTYGAFAFMLPAGYLAEVLGYRAVILLGLLRLIRR